MKKANLFIIIGLLLVAVALCLTVYNFWDDYRAGKASDEVLEYLEKLIPDTSAYNEDENSDPGIEFVDDEGNPVSVDEIEYPDYILDPNMHLIKKQVGGNYYIGVINIPAIGRTFPVFAEWSYANLKTAPCLFSGSPYLDNMVICAHNYRRHFGRIGNLNIGDIVTFTDMDGNFFRYHVSEVVTLKPNNYVKMTDGKNWDLSLFTCNMSGNARVTVRCVRY